MIKIVKLKNTPELPDKDISNQDISDAITQYGMTPGSPPKPDLIDNSTIPAPPKGDEEIEDPLEGLDQLDAPEEEPSEQELMEEAPSPPSSEEPEYHPYGEYDAQQSHSQMYPSSTDIQGLIESVIEEKWEDFMSKTGDLNIWKEQINNELTAIKQEIIRTQDRFENLQKGVMGKVGEYGSSVKEMGTEIKALEHVFQKILQPLSENIRELQRVTTKIKAQPMHKAPSKRKPTRKETTKRKTKK